MDCQSLEIKFFAAFSEFQSIDHKPLPKFDDIRHLSKELRWEIFKENNLSGDKVLRAFKELQKSSDENEYYFNLCSFEVYKKTYAERRNHYLSEYPDSNNRDFARQEIIEDDYLIKSFALLADEIEYSLKRRKEFLKQEIKNPQKTVSNESMTVFQAVYLLEQLGTITTMQEKYDDTFISKIIAKLIGRNAQNIRKTIINLEKPLSKITEGHLKDMDEIDEMLTKK